jgi:hypothetical protein
MKGNYRFQQPHEEMVHYEPKMEPTLDNKAKK